MAQVTLLDGGMGQELLARSGDTAAALWATQVMRDHPGLVAQVHTDYFAAGATVATTNSYAIHHDRLTGFGLDGQFGALHAQALAEARAARTAHGAGARIAGSLGPLVASYRPDMLPPHAEAAAKYAEIARLMAPEVDLILCETVASLAHARAVLEGAAVANLPVWLSVTVDDDDGHRLRSGEPVAALADLPSDAILANCSAPEAMPAALADFARMGRPFGAYANGFRQTTKEFLNPDPTHTCPHTRPEMTPALYADHALRWVDQGATLIGGCCETTPAHIAAIARRLLAAGHRIC